MSVRVLHLIGSLETGGAETALVRICKATQPLNLDHQILVIGSTGPLGEELQATGIPVWAPRACKSGRNGVLSLSHWRPQVIHGWMYHGSLAALVMRSVIFPGAALAWNIRCGLDTPSQHRGSTRSLIRLLATLSSIPEAILYNATSARAAHEAVGYRSTRGEVIPNGFDLEVFRPDPVARQALRSELNLAGEAQLIGLVARFHSEKNPGLFLRALARLPNRVHGIMSGPGMIQGNLELMDQVNELGLHDRVHLLGDRSDMPRIMAGLDFAVSASWNEGFSNALGEAQACGVPCVATKVGDSEVILGGHGRVVPPGEPEAMARALRELLGLTPEDRVALGRHCRRRMENLFNLSLVGDRYAALYRRLADRL